MHRGYVKIWRNFKESGLLEHGPTLQVFMKALLDATHEKYTLWVGTRPVILDKGQFVFGRKAWAGSLGLSEKMVRSAMDRLKRKKWVVCAKKASTYSVYSFVDWDTYQGNEIHKKKQPGQQKATVRPHKTTPSHISEKETVLEWMRILPPTHQTDDIREALVSWYRYQQTMEKKPSENQCNSFLRLVTQVDANTVAASIDQAISGGYRTIQLPSVKSTSRAYVKKQSPACCGTVGTVLAAKAFLESEDR